MFYEKRKKLNQVQKKKKNNEIATQSVFNNYLHFIRGICECEMVFVVIDARSPDLCRYTVLEDNIKDKMVFILNKIDLVPRESVIGWVEFLSTIAPTIALSAKESIEPIIEFIEQKNIKSVSITGLKNMGKRTILSQLNHVSAKITDDWFFITPSPELAIIQGMIPKKPHIVFGYAVSFLSQCSQQSVSEVFECPGFSDSEALIIHVFGDNLMESGKLFFAKIANDEIRFYSPPPTVSAPPITFSDAQQKSLKLASLHDAYPKSWLSLLTNGYKNTVLPSIVKSIHKNSKKISVNFT